MRVKQSLIRGEVVTALTIGSFLVLSAITLLSNLAIKDRKIYQSRAQSPIQTSCSGSCSPETAYCATCMNPKEQQSCASDAGVALVHRCSGGQWVFNPGGGIGYPECRIECKPDGGGGGGGDTQPGGQCNRGDNNGCGGAGGCLWWEYCRDDGWCIDTTNNGTQPAQIPPACGNAVTPTQSAPPTATRVPPTSVPPTATSAPTTQPRGTNTPTPTTSCRYDCLLYNTCSQMGGTNLGQTGCPNGLVCCQESINQPTNTPRPTNIPRPTNTQVPPTATRVPPTATRTPTKTQTPTKTPTPTVTPTNVPGCAQKGGYCGNYSIPCCFDSNSLCSNQICITFTPSPTKTPTKTPVPPTATRVPPTTTPATVTTTVPVTPTSAAVTTFGVTPTPTPGAGTTTTPGAATITPDVDTPTSIPPTPIPSGTPLSEFTKDDRIFNIDVFVDDKEAMGYYINVNPLLNLFDTYVSYGKPPCLRENCKRDLGNQFDYVSIGYNSEGYRIKYNKLQGYYEQGTLQKTNFDYKLTWNAEPTPTYETKEEGSFTFELGEKEKTITIPWRIPLSEYYKSILFSLSNSHNYSIIGPVNVNFGQPPIKNIYGYKLDNSTVINDLSNTTIVDAGNHMLTLIADRLFKTETNFTEKNKVTFQYICLINNIPYSQSIEQEFTFQNNSDVNISYSCVTD